MAIFYFTDRESSCGQFQLDMTSTSNLDGNLSTAQELPGVETPRNARKRQLEMPLTSSTIASCSDIDLPEASTGNRNQTTPAPSRSHTRQRQKQAKPKAAEDTLFQLWLESQIETNAARRSWLEADTKKINAKVELIKLLKRKTLLEINNFDSQARQ